MSWMQETEWVLGSGPCRRLIWRAHACAQGYEREEEALGLRQRLAEFARENGKFADVKRSLKEEVAQLQAALAAKSGEAAQLLDMCNALMSDVEAARGAGKASAAAAEGAPDAAAP
jgi:hypothetical protein